MSGANVVHIGPPIAPGDVTITVTTPAAKPRRRTHKPKRFEVRHGRFGVIWHVEALDFNEAVVFAVRVVPSELQDDCQVREVSK